MEDMGKLSPEQLRKFANIISEIKNLPDRQAEIIEKIITGEIDIGKTRIAYLKEYFDIYSRNLDAIAKKQSQLNETFLILDKKSNMSQFASNGQTSANNSSKKDNSSKSSNQGNNGGSGNEDTGKTNKPTGKKVTNMDKNDLEELDLSEVTEASLKEAEEKKAETLKRLADLTAFYHQSEEERAQALLEYQAALEAKKQEERIKRYENFANKRADIEKTFIALNSLRNQDQIDQEDAVTKVRLDRIQTVLEAEQRAQEAVNNVEANLGFAGLKEDGRFDEVAAEEAVDLRGREQEAKEKLKQAKDLEDAINKYRAKKELEIRRKNNGILTKDAAVAIEKEIAKKFTLEKMYDKKRIENLAKLEEEKTRKTAREASQESVNSLIGTDKTAAERKQAFHDLTHDSESGERDNAKAISAALVAVSDLATKLEKKIDDIASHKGFIDTRLQGSSNDKFMGSYWDQLTRDMTSVGAVNPFFKQEKFAENIKSLVDKGIAFDLKQRAFLMTIQEKIANTFNVADGTLLRLIRIQQEDSTAGRLGMESALNSFLNNMYETSEYLSDVAASVRGSLEEMQALMQGSDAVEVEFQVQKWLGSMYSVGMSQNAVKGIADTLGQIAAGQIEGLTSGGTGNLLIMAANEAGLSIADILTSGIDSKDTNKLLQAAVNYLAGLAESSKDNKVVQQQLANVFGVKASDLKAATNITLPGSTNSILGTNLTYEGMLGQLHNMAGSMYQRTSIAEMMTNIWENGQYTLAGSMASNPISYLIYKLAKIVDDAAGGIDLPFVNVMGFGVDLNTTVSDLMRVAAVGTGLLGSLAPMISGLGSSFSGRAMLNKLGIKSGTGLEVTPRGDGSIFSNNQGTNGFSTTESGYVGNASSSDIKDSTIQEAENNKKQLMIEAKEEAEANEFTILNNTVIKIYELLDDVAKGDLSLRVRVDDYGLTRGGSSSSSGSQGGSSLLSSGNAGTSVSTNSQRGMGVSSGGINGNIELQGWTTSI